MIWVEQDTGQEPTRDKHTTTLKKTIQQEITETLTEKLTTMTRENKIDLKLELAKGEIK